MAVDAQYHSFVTQFQNREKMYADNTNGLNNLNLGFGIPISLAETLQSFPGVANFQQINDSGINLWTNGGVVSDPQSSLTCNNLAVNIRKRSRELISPVLCRNPVSSTVLSRNAGGFGDEVVAEIERQQQEVDNFVTLHLERVRLELEERHRGYARRLRMALAQGLVKELKQKEEEIDRIAKMNSALEERVNHLSAENQIWQSLARSNEATANALRTNLEQALANNAASFVEGSGDSEDGNAAESTTNKKRRTEEEEAGAEPETESGRKKCAGCRSGEADVLILPCRHLCACVACAQALSACPVCKTPKRAILQVYLS